MVTKTLICAACGSEAPATEPRCASCEADVLLDGRYRLDAVVGRGAMGVTYRATRLVDGTIVAVKELAFRRVDSNKTTDLFAREARVLRSLAHAAIPRFIDDFTVGHGKQMALCIVQEFIDGTTLEAEIQMRRPNEKTVFLAIAEVAKTLAYLAELRPPVVHRDIKPQNIMRRRSDDSLVLIDFGSVREALRGSLDGGSTVAGTFGYMAPEQFSGQATAATDVYGLGATALALLAGTGADKLLGPDGRLDWKARVAMSPAMGKLIDAMLSTDPARRPPAEDVITQAEVLAEVPHRPTLVEDLPARQVTEPSSDTREAWPPPSLPLVKARDGVDPVTGTMIVLACVGGFLAFLALL